MTNFQLLHKLVELQVWKRDLQVSAITRRRFMQQGPSNSHHGRFGTRQWHVKESLAPNAIRNNIFANYQADT